MRQNRSQKFVREGLRDQIHTLDINQNGSLSQLDINLITEETPTGFPADAFLVFEHLIHFKGVHFRLCAIQIQVLEGPYLKDAPWLSVSQIL